MEKATSFLDLFCMRKGHIDIDTLRTIITCQDPARYGMWERLVLEKYGRFMPNMVTRRVRFAVNTADPYLDITFIFFVCMGFEPACQRIITKQLERERCVPDYVFFTQEFVKFAKHAITILLRYPVTADDAHHVVNTCVSVLQMTWLSKTVYFSVVSTRFELATRDRDLRRRAEEAKAKERPRAGALPTVKRARASE